MLLASDFDNTLYVSDINIVNKNIKSINKFREKGNLFVIITGRGNSIRKYIEEFNIPYDYLVCENGAIIYDKDDNIVSSTYLHEEDINKVINIIKRDNLDFILDTGKDYLNEFNDFSSSIACIFLDKKTITNPEELLNEILNTTNTYSYLSENWINIVDKNIDKKIALDKLNEILNNKYEIHAIGDAINDISMITSYNGAIMKNHEKELNSLQNKEYDSLFEYIEELI
mgnify:CR=1 FL=1